jgi:hypothetical protein
VGQEAVVNRGRIKFLLLAAVFAAPIALSYVAYYFWKPTRTGNYGELLNPPVAIAASLLRVSDATHQGPQPLAGKWLLITRDSGNCIAACQKKLLAMRLAHRALGKEQERVQRILLVDDGESRSPVDAASAEGLFFLDARGSDLLRVLPAPRDPRDSIYIVDPLGNLFMRYPGNPDIKGVVRDLERVLKASKIG